MHKSLYYILVQGFRVTCLCIPSFTQKLNVNKCCYLMSPPLSPYCRNIEINTTANRDFTLTYYWGKLGYRLYGQTGQEPSIHLTAFLFQIYVAESLHEA